MKHFLLGMVFLFGFNAYSAQGVTALQLSQSTLESLKSLVRKEKVTLDKVSIIAVNPAFSDSVSGEELIEIKASFINAANVRKPARFLCHAAEHMITEASQPHCHRTE